MSSMLPFKERVRSYVQRLHEYLVSSSFARIYCFLVLAPRKLKKVEIHGSTSYFVVDNSYHNFYVDRFTTLFGEIDTQDYLLNNLQQGDVFYDVGANIGAYVIWAAKASDLEQVVAFEPSSSNYSALVRNVDANDLSNVVCLPVAISSDSGYEKFWVTGKSGKTLGYLDSYVQKMHRSSFEIVRKEKIDNLIENGLIKPPSVVLMDVDGGELDVLNGMSRALETCRIVIVEVSPATELVVDELLKSRGFSMEVEKNKRVGNRMYKKGGG